MTHDFNRRPLHGLLTATAFTLACLTGTAEAGLVRGGGGSVQQDSFNETVELYDESTLDFRASRVVSGTSIGSYSRNSLHFPAYATPPELCWDNINRDIPGVETRTACHYEFYVGELLELMGATQMHINGADYLLNWHIEGNGRSWDFDNNSLDHAFLQMVMPEDMSAGEYWVRFTFSQIAPDGFTLFRYSNILDPNRCDEAENRDGTGSEMVCGQIGTLIDSTSWSDGTRLVILDRPVEVPTPASLLLMAGGMLLLTRQRR